MFINQTPISTVMEETQRYVSLFKGAQSSLKRMLEADNVKARTEAMNELVEVDKMLGGTTASMMSLDRIRENFQTMLMLMARDPGKLDKLIDFVRAKDVDEKASDFLESVKSQHHRGSGLSERQVSYLTRLYFGYLE